MRSATVVKDGAIISPPPPPKPKTTPKPATAVKTEPDKAKAQLPAPFKRYLPMIVGALMLYGLGAVAPPHVCATFNRIRARLLYRLYGDLECHPFPAHTTDECHQCDQ